MSEGRSLPKGIVNRAARTLSAFALAVAGLPLLGSAALAQDTYVVTGAIDWGIYVDPDGCMHWWSDGGAEGYMVTRFHPNTGRPYCLDVNTCMVQNTDAFFATDSHHLTPHGKARLEAFFRDAGAFSYSVYGHTDERASQEYNQALSERRARSVGNVARSVGAIVERQIGFGETRPVARGNNEHAWRQNRRVEVVCYRLPE